MGQVAEHVAGGVAALADGDAQTDRPNQDADEVGFHQRGHRVGHGTAQQAQQDLGDVAGRREVIGAGSQGDGRGEDAGSQHRHHRCGEGADQVEEEDRADVGALARLVVGDGSDHQDEHQHRRHGLQGHDEKLAEQADGAGVRGGDQGEGDAGDQADDDPGHQAGAFQALQDGAVCMGHGRYR
ncbi:hypothetical protein D9M71_659520 [compost metagenome]